VLSGLNRRKTPAPWPYWSLFFCGRFGAATPASRRLNRESLVGLRLLMASVLGCNLLDSAVPGGKRLMIPGAALLACSIVLAYHRYFAQFQAELAERLGVSRQTTNAIENRKYDPSLPLAFKIGDIFDPNGDRSPSA
jgi:DNA-binding XRE family transcriptional regulator